MDKIKISKVIVVEGKYDKIKLDSILDATIITTDGFGIFKEKEKLGMLRRLADERGLIIACDSDGAGMLIRNHFNGSVDKNKLIHVYIPQVKGKERRKKIPSKEGTLGVEGIEIKTLVDLFSPYASSNDEVRFDEITLTDLYNDGFRGKDGSEEKRKRLAEKLDLPQNLSAKALVNAINLLGGVTLYNKAKDNIND